MCVSLSFLCACACAAFGELEPKRPLESFLACARAARVTSDCLRGSLYIAEYCSMDCGGGQHRRAVCQSSVAVHEKLEGHPGCLLPLSPGPPLNSF